MDISKIKEEKNVNLNVLQMLSELPEGTDPEPGRQSCERGITEPWCGISNTQAEKCHSPVLGVGGQLKSAWCRDGSWR